MKIQYILPAFFAGLMTVEMTKAICPREITNAEYQDLWKNRDNKQYKYKGCQMVSGWDTDYGDKIAHLKPTGPHQCSYSFFPEPWVLNFTLNCN